MEEVSLEDMLSGININGSTLMEISVNLMLDATKIAKHAGEISTRKNDNRVYTSRGEDLAMPMEDFLLSKMEATWMEMIINSVAAYGNRMASLFIMLHQVHAETHASPNDIGLASSRFCSLMWACGFPYSTKVYTEKRRQGLTSKWELSSGRPYFNSSKSDGSSVLKEIHPKLKPDQIEKDDNYLRSSANDWNVDDYITNAFNYASKKEAKEEMIKTILDSDACKLFLYPGMMIAATDIWPLVNSLIFSYPLPKNYDFSEPLLYTCFTKLYEMLKKEKSLMACIQWARNFSISIKQDAIHMPTLIASISRRCRRHATKRFNASLDIKEADNVFDRLSLSLDLMSSIKDYTFFQKEDPRLRELQRTRIADHKFEQVFIRMCIMEFGQLYGKRFLEEVKLPSAQETSFQDNPTSEELVTFLEIGLTGKPVKIKPMAFKRPKVILFSKTAGIENF